MSSWTFNAKMVNSASDAFVMPNGPTIWFGNRCTSTHIITASEVANATPSQSVLRTRAMIFAP